jgi:hypothetical protein
VNHQPAEMIGQIAAYENLFSAHGLPIVHGRLKNSNRFSHDSRQPVLVAPDRRVDSANE